MVNMKKLLEQAQSMQAEMEKKIKGISVEASAGGGMVHGVVMDEGGQMQKLHGAGQGHGAGGVGAGMELGGQQGDGGA